MKIVDCPWEIENIGKKTIEITLDGKNENLQEVLKAIRNEYEYVVVKIPMNMVEYNCLMAKECFTCMEVQMNVSINPVQFDYSKISHISAAVRMRPESGNKGIEKVLSHITPKMFSTDRITLDKEFGPAIGMRRYQNWLTAEVKSGKSQLVQMIYKGAEVGFMLYRITDSFFHLLLNGLYEEWQGKHLGIITPSSPLLLLKQTDEKVSVVGTSISSNNIPVVKLYNRLGFTLDSQTYVFTKHLK